MKNLVYILLATFLFSGATYAGELDLLNIESISQKITESGLEVTVTMMVPCHLDYKGLLLEDVSDRLTLSETKMEVRAVAKNRGFLCAAADMPVEDTVTISPFIAGSYTFLPIEPR